MDFVKNIKSACSIIKKVKQSGGGLLILTGAGMSVNSGVPVFRSADGTMSPDFLRYLGNYNTARTNAGKPPAADWFDFSVPEMFKNETEKEAWQYWRWRILRAQVKPASDYKQLQRLVDYFGQDKVFVKTSNCDQLHVAAGVDANNLEEIHGSLGLVQCSNKCCDELWPVDDRFVERLEAEPDWVPRCTQCQLACLRPNVMIFGDDKLVHTVLEQQSENLYNFTRKFDINKSPANFAVIEIGAGVVVPSIRMAGETYGTRGQCLVRINPSESECQGTSVQNTYFPLVAKSELALEALATELGLG